MEKITKYPVINHGSCRVEDENSSPMRNISAEVDGPRGDILSKTSLELTAETDYRNKKNECFL
jgi:hypothetical protein